MKRVFCEVFRLEPDTSCDELRLGEIHQWDSLGHMNLINAIEKRFGFEFSFEEIMGVQSFQDASRIVEEKLARA